MEHFNTFFRKIPTWVVWTGCVLPLLGLIWKGFNNDLGADPVKEIEHGLGEVGLQLLILSLCVTPLRTYGLNLIKFRRALGVMAFFYVFLHFLVWLTLDMGFRWSEITRDFYRRPYITMGLIGFLVMLPLAITSTNNAVRGMGAMSWRRLHRLAYIAVVAGVVHYILLVKGWQTEPLVYAALTFLILSLRLPFVQSFVKRP